jgi:hypothetical protein
MPLPAAPGKSRTQGRGFDSAAPSGMLACMKHPLDALVGHWNTTGESVPDAAGRATAIKGMDKYEWLPGRKFLLHYADVWMGEEKVNVVEVIGPCADELAGIPMNSFDSSGQHAVMQAELRGPDEWMFSGTGLRATLTLGKNGRSMSASWERQGAGERWEPWLTMQFAKTT